MESRHNRQASSLGKFIIGMSIFLLSTVSVGMACAGQVNAESIPLLIGLAGVCGIGIGVGVLLTV